ncbi:DUF6712 family protein [Spirosoma litoris]
MALLIDGVKDLQLAGVPVNKNFTLTLFEPYLESTWSELFPTFLGREFTESLAQVWQSPSELTDAQKALLPYLRRPLCQLAFAQYLPFAEVQLADDGITTSASQDRKPATERQIIAIRNALYESGWKHLEGLLAYLDFHQTDFPLYVTYRDLQPASLLPSAGEFSKYYQIFGSRITYNALKPTLTGLEADVLIPRLDSRWPSIVDSDSLDDRSLLRQARTWLACQTVVDAIPTLAIAISGNGLKVHYSSNIDNIEYVQPPSEAQIERLLQKAKEKASAAWLELASLLDGEPEAEKGRGMMDNDDRKIVFF